MVSLTFETEKELHDLRIDQRRLEALIFLLIGSSQKETLRKFERPLRCLRAKTGRIREVDILAAAIRSRSARMLVRPIEKALAVRRKSALKKLKKLLRTRALRALIKLHPIKSAKPLGVHLRQGDSKALKKRRKMLVTEVRKNVQGAVKSSPTRPRPLHRLRVSLRRLRYGDEWLATLGIKSLSKQKLRHYKECQRFLGAFQDHITNVRLLKILLKDAKKSSDPPKILGVLREVMRMEKSIRTVYWTAPRRRLLSKHLRAALW